MDPADTDSLRQALATQGALIRQHNKVLHEVVDQFYGFTSSVTQLSRQMEQISTHLPVPSAFTASASSANSAPSCSIASPAQPRKRLAVVSSSSAPWISTNSSLPTPEISPCVAFVISLLVSKDTQWASALWESSSRICNSFPLTKSERRKVIEYRVRSP